MGHAEYDPPFNAFSHVLNVSLAAAGLDRKLKIYSSPASIERYSAELTLSVVLLYVKIGRWLTYSLRDVGFKLSPTLPVGRYTA